MRHITHIRMRSSKIWTRIIQSEPFSVYSDDEWLDYVANDSSDTRSYAPKLPHHTETTAEPLLRLLAPESVDVDEAEEGEFMPVFDERFGYFVSGEYGTFTPQFDDRIERYIWIQDFPRRQKENAATFPPLESLDNPQDGERDGVIKVGDSHASSPQNLQEDATNYESTATASRNTVPSDNRMTEVAQAAMAITATPSLSTAETGPVPPPAIAPAPTPSIVPASAIAPAPPGPPLLASISDGDPLHLPDPSENAVPANQTQIRGWIQRLNKLLEPSGGGTPPLVSLPTGYRLYAIPRPGGPRAGYKDLFLFGHPAHDRFGNAAQFCTHLRWLMTGQNGYCKCICCRRAP